MPQACGRLRRTGRLVRTTRLIRPNYAGRFRCIGSACEDDCCHSWSVTIDEDSYRKYLSLPDGPLRASILTAIDLAPGVETGFASKSYASIKMPISGICPFLNKDRLCRIHAQLGPDCLPSTCRFYPRIPRTIDDLEEETLSLSCPEAARLILLAETLFPPGDGPALETVWDDSASCSSPIRSYFWVLRDFTIRLAVNRKYSLWKRLFLLGTFCRRLDAILREEPKRTVPDFLRDFSAAVDSGTLNGPMESIRPDPAAQLEMVLRLVGLRTGSLELSPRLTECVRAVADGIGWRAGVPLPSHVACYESSYRDYYAPFFDRHPLILENYLMNQMLRHVFPFGIKLFETSAVPEFAQTFAELATQFALTKGLLIGVAGFYRERFSIDHVVQVVLSISRHFEHSPEFLADAAALLHERKMDNAQGLAMLLRN